MFCVLCFVDFSGTDSSDPTSPCGVLDIDTILSDLTFLNNPSVTAEERETNFQENSFLSQPKDQSSSKTQHDDKYNRVEVLVFSVLILLFVHMKLIVFFTATELQQMLLVSLMCITNDAERVGSSNALLRMTQSV